MACVLGVIECTKFVFMNEAASTNTIQFGSIGKINETDCRTPMAMANNSTRNVSCLCAYLWTNANMYAEHRIGLAL